MDELKEIYKAINTGGFSESTLLMIDKLVNDIQNGTRDFYRYNSPEHAGLCTAGKVLIGASIITCYATASITASCNAEGREGSPANWEIDELAASKGFHDNWSGQGVNYISERIALEDMHPANVFVDETSMKPICIDCIVKFV
ncbi:MAG: hypothetical protein IJ544_02295 [Prevotella sp.]|nr:hypothetical protein [Prevotella sp.]